MTMELEELLKTSRCYAEMAARNLTDLVPETSEPRLKEGQIISLQIVFLFPNVGTYLLARLQCLAIWTKALNDYAVAVRNGTIPQDQIETMRRLIHTKEICFCDARSAVEAARETFTELQREVLTTDLFVPRFEE